LVARVALALVGWALVVRVALALALVVRVALALALVGV